MNFDELYRDFFPPLVQTASVWLSHEDAEDMVQDVMLRLWQRRERLVFIDDFYTYARTAVRRRCIDHLRHRVYVRRYQYDAADVVRTFCEFETPERRAELHELEERVERVVSTLPQRSRTVFMMSRYEDCRNADIARRLNISENTVENHMTLALRHLRNNLKVS